MQKSKRWLSNIYICCNGLIQHVRWNLQSINGSCTVPCLDARGPSATAFVAELVKRECVKICFCRGFWSMHVITLWPDWLLPDFESAD